jgi:iron complex outermembrane receptor protein
MRKSLAAALAVVVLGGHLFAQDAGEPGDRKQEQPPTFEEQVEVVGVTPIHGVGVSRLKVPANVQTFTVSSDGTRATTDVATLLNSRATSVHTVEAQAGTFQPDVMFRGFGGSPLLGASEGIAVYQDGVRINEAFGDTINWDLLPSGAIASVNLMPGSNPLFGLNALGGALSIQTKDGFANPGHRALFTTGSFGRHRIEVQSAASSAALGYFVAGALRHDGGWRDFSPSTVRSLFGNLEWRRATTAVNIGVTAASNDLRGNGTVPLSLFEAKRDAVFTHPDLTQNDSALVTLKARRQFASTFLEGVVYYRHSSVSTFNGDAADLDDDDADEGHDADDVSDDDDDDDDADDDDSEDDDDDAPGDGAELNDEAAIHDVFDAVNNTSDTRAHSGGIAGQMTSTAALFGRDNHFVAGGGFDAAATQFDFATELARLTADRGTVGTGLFDEDAFVDLDSRTMTSSAFATNTWSATTRLAVTGSARFNRIHLRMRDQIGTELSGDHDFWRLNPSAGLTFQAKPSLNLYGSYAQSSRAPTPVELTCADPDDPCRLPNAFVSDPPLDQIVATTWEAGARGRRAPFNWTIALFASGASDDIIFVSSGTLRGEGHFENVERTRRRGIETSIEYETSRMSVYATYTLQRATFGSELRLTSPQHPEAEAGEILVEEGARVPGVPSHSAKAGIATRLAGRIDVGVDVRAQSGQFFRGDEANLLPMIPGFAVVNARAGRRLTSQISVLVEAQNIFDANFFTFGGLGDASLVDDDDPRFYSPGTPRAVWAGVEVRF